MLKMLIIVLLVFSCGKKTNYVKVKGDTTEVEKIVEVEIEKIIEKSQEFEGYYYLKNNGFIELVANSRGDITVVTELQQILSKNPQNGTIAEHPRLYGSHIQIIDNKLKWTRNENYTSGQDLEEDVNGSNIIGQKRTDYTIELIDGKLKITILVWDDKIGNNINNVIAKRIIKED